MTKEKNELGYIDSWTGYQVTKAGSVAFKYPKSREGRRDWAFQPEVVTGIIPKNIVDLGSMSVREHVTHRVLRRATRARLADNLRESKKRKLDVPITVTIDDVIVKARIVHGEDSWKQFGTRRGVLVKIESPNRCIRTGELWPCTRMVGYERLFTIRGTLQSWVIAEALWYLRDVYRENKRVQKARTAHPQSWSVVDMLQPLRKEICESIRERQSPVTRARLEVVARLRHGKKRQSFNIDSIAKALGGRRF